MMNADEILSPPRGSAFSGRPALSFLLVQGLLLFLTYAYAQDLSEQEPAQVLLSYWPWLAVNAALLARYGWRLKRARAGRFYRHVLPCLYGQLLLLCMGYHFCQLLSPGLGRGEFVGSCWPLLVLNLAVGIGYLRRWKRLGKSGEPGINLAEPSPA